MVDPGVGILFLAGATYKIYMYLLGAIQNVT